jgi:hypothetical protein
MTKIKVRLLIWILMLVILFGLLNHDWNTFDDIEGMTKRSATLIEQRKSESLNYTTNEKAIFFQSQIYNEFMKPPYHLVSKSSSNYIFDAQTTAHYLSSLAFKCASQSNNTELETEILAIIDDLMKLDEANGYDGYIPKLVIIDNDSLKVIDDDSHANLFSQVLSSYLLIYTLCDDKYIKSKVADHTTLIADYFLSNDMLLRNSTGVIVEHSDLRPKTITIQKGRSLQGLMVLESALITLPSSNMDGNIIFKDKLLGKKYEFIKAGYYNDIKNLNLRIGQFIWPTHSSSWLYMIQLHSLSVAGAGEVYENAFQKLYAVLKKEKNPLFDIMYMDVLEIEDQEIIKNARIRLKEFPTDRREIEIVNSGRTDIKTPFFRRYIKGKQVEESVSPLPIYERPQDGNEWKRNQFRIDGNIGKSGGYNSPSTDFLQLYWAVQAVKERINLRNTT